ncbi:GNAT family N-acetyltransferase [Leuconostoc mesenteroides]
MIIRLATLSDLNHVTKLTYDAFRDYPLFNVSTEKSQSQQALYFLLYLNTLANIRREDCFVCVEESEIVASFILKAPYHHHISIWTYVKIGGWRLPFKCSPKIARRIMRNLSQSDNIMPKEFESFWYVDTLVVSPKHQGQKIGSRTISQIIDMVEKRDGKAICLITNTAINSVFYQKNGFNEINKLSFTSFGQVNDTWVFKYEYPSR